jgi:hypothetical protein
MWKRLEDWFHKPGIPVAEYHHHKKDRWINLLFIPIELILLAMNKTMTVTIEDKFQSGQSKGDNHDS